MWTKGLGGNRTVHSLCRTEVLSGIMFGRLIPENLF